MTLARNILREIKATLWQGSVAAGDPMREDPQSDQRLPPKNIAEFYALAPVGYFTLSPDGLIQEVNPTGTKLLRVKREQLLNRPFAEFVAKKHRQRFHEQLKVHADGQPSRRTELRLKRSTGKPCYAHVEVRGLIDHEQKKITGWLMTVTDVSATKRAKDNVRRGRKFLGKVLESLTHPFFVINVDDFTVELANTAGLKGHAPRKVTCFSLLHERSTPCEMGGHLCPLREVKRTRRPVTLEHVHYDAKGQVGYSEIHGYPVFDSRGQVTQMIEYAIDITPRKKMEESLRASQESFRNVVLANQTGIVVTDKEGIVLFSNPTARHFLARKKQQLDGQPLGLAVSSGREIAIARLCNERGVAELKVKDTQWERQPANLIVLHDVTERKNAEAAIEHMAYHDPLTGLPNRQMFLERLTNALSRAKRSRRLVAVLFLDLDRFKVINDTLGHAMGDQCLREVAARLINCVRGTDTVARLAGDEFTILLEGLEKIEQVRRVCRAIVKALNSVFHIDGNEVFSPASIGVSCHPDDGADAETLIKQADTAMYHAKARGKNNVQFYRAELGARVAELISLENSLRRALERDEFVLFYQPTLDISSGRIVGLEALLRWQHPERGLVQPNEIIPVLEEIGLLASVSEWALRTACTQIKEWQDAGLPETRIAVNLSAGSLRSTNMVETIAQTLNQRGLDAKFLELEITESALMPDNNIAASTLTQLRNINVKISIDDFGTGYSSLSHLKRFPVDRLKIDRSFIRGIPNDTNDTAISTSIIAMAHALDLKVVAEGVETEDQLAFLRTQECDEMQGFLFSPPLPADEITPMLEQRQGLH
jgi:diguanylate cyclase (GGDEF)-like protein/PAS domain S-box-containing protein